MTVRVYSTPQLADFYMVCHALCEDEREQYRAFAGEEFDPAIVAAAYYLRDCPKWVVVGESGPYLMEILIPQNQSYMHVKIDWKNDIYS